MVLLQNVLLPDKAVCNEEELYFRRKGEVYYDEFEKILVLSKSSKVLFNTYFNVFSIKKWMKYTHIEDLFFEIVYSGNITVNFFLVQIKDLVLTTRLIFKVPFSSAEKDVKTIRFKKEMFMEKDAIAVYFEIEAMEDNSKFYGGRITTNPRTDEINEVSIAAIITTFKREKYILRNMQNIVKYIDSDSGDLKGKLHLYVVDNGRTLSSDKIKSDVDYITIIPNKNVGGSGGFTRGIIEALTDRDKKQYTHILLMDDDIVFELETFVRTYSFLKLLKKEYRNSIIGGSMLRLDRQSIQHERGAIWLRDRVKSINSNLDLKIFENVIHNELEKEFAEYNAWWFCCIPITYVIQNGLPLPLFIKTDDIEYSIRNKVLILFINGICVWHEPFENKYSSFLNYYVMRNHLIINSIHCPDFNVFKALKMILRWVVREIFYYRYNNAELILKAVEDFLKGPQFLMENDGEELHREVSQCGEKMREVTEEEMTDFDWLSQISYFENESRIRRIIRLMLLNGYLLPLIAFSNRGKNGYFYKGEYKVVPVVGCRPINFYRVRKVIQYDSNSGKIIVTEINKRKFLKLCKRLIYVILKFVINYRKTCKDYQHNFKKITSLDFWLDYLGINNTNKE